MVPDNFHRQKKGIVSFPTSNNFTGTKYRLIITVTELFLIQLQVCVPKSLLAVQWDWTFLDK